MLRYFVALLLLSWVCFASASDPVVNLPPEIHTDEKFAGDKQLQKQLAPKAGFSSSVGWLSSLELWLSVSVLLFGLITLCIEISVIKSGAFKPDDSIKLLAVTLIVVSTLFIITAGFDSEQIAPAMGLFGTVAGYMLGKVTPNKES